MLFLFSNRQKHEINYHYVNCLSTDTKINARKGYICFSVIFFFFLEKNFFARAINCFFDAA